MRHAASITAVLVIAAGLAGCEMMHSMHSGGGAWTTLIDGANGLENFNRVGDANWRAEDGAIVADHKDSKPSAFLMTKESYSDYELRVEFWVSHDANSGVYMRCANGAAPTDTTCYEANIFDERPDPSYGTGAITNFAKIVDMPKAGGKWNTFDITAKGGHIAVKMNGKPTVELDHDKLKSGPFGLQYAAGVVKFRKVQIRPL
jgi:hypothetical protein